jgi:hypothetical protein
VTTGLWLSKNPNWTQSKISSCWQPSEYFSYAPSAPFSLLLLLLLLLLLYFVAYLVFAAAAFYALLFLALVSSA